MRTSLATLAACSLIAAASIATASTTPAEAAASCSRPATIVSTTISPKTVVVGTSVPKGITITTKIRTNGCRIDRVEAGLYGPNFVDTFDLDKVESSGGVTTYDTGLRISPGDLPNTEAGRWQSYITVTGQSSPEAPGPDFKILRAAKLTTNATPEPVRKGAKLTVKGKLTRASWDSMHYRGYGKRTVELQRRTPHGTYKLVKKVTTAADGSIVTKVKAKSDGCYRFVFRGTGTTRKVTSKGDCVDVR